MSVATRSRLPDGILHRVRNEILSRFKSDQNSYDVDDIVRNIQTDDTLILLFCLQYLDDHPKDELQNNDKMFEKVYKNLLETLKWRKSYGLSRFLYSDFPEEYYSRGHITVGKNRHENTVLLVFDHSRHSKINTSLSRLLKDFLLFFTEKVTSDFIRKGYDVHIIFDYSKASYSNLDPSLLIDFLTTVTTHYPSIVKLSFAYSLPWYTNALVKMLMRILPARVTSNFIVVDKESIFKELHLQLIPDYMGGMNNMENIFLSQTPHVTLKDFQEKLGISQHDVRKLIESYEVE
jgi:hypothetical protein